MMTLFDLNVHLLVVENVVSLRSLCDTWFSQPLSKDTAAQATNCIVPCLRLMRDAANDHSLALSDWHWENADFERQRKALVLLDWCGTEVCTELQPYKRYKGLGKAFGWT